MSLPLSASNVKLMRGIKWRNDYKHTRYFSSIGAQTSWFNNQTVVHQIAQCNIVKVEGKSYVQVNANIDSLWNVNYMSFINNTVTNSNWYCFVTKLEYLNKTTTRVYFEVDVYQTWYLYSTWRPSYVERQHVQEYVAGYPAVHTIDEGLDYGPMYDTIEVQQVKPSGEVLFLIVVCKQVLEENGGDENGEIKPMLNGMPQPLTFYVVPFLRDGTVPTVTPDSVSKVDKVLEYMYSAQSAVNNIVSIYTTDYIGLNNADGSSVHMPIENFKKVLLLKGITSDSVGVYRLTNMYGYQTKTISLGSKYPIPLDVNEPGKLWMSPYYKIFLDDFQGNRVEIRPEYINSNNLNIKVKGSIGTNNKVSYEVLAYNYGVSEPFVDQVGLEYGLINSNPNDVPIITDLLAAYLQGNRNSIENQTNQTVFNGVMGVVGGAGQTISGAVNRSASGVVGGAMSIAQTAGDTIFALQGIQAKQKDIDNTPPSITNQGGNNYFTVGNGYRGLYVIKKRIKPEYLTTIGTFLQRYGYKYNRHTTPVLTSRKTYNFIKTIDCLLAGTFPQEYLVQLQSVFDRGITVWHTDDIGNYNLTNGVNI